MSNGNKSLSLKNKLAEIEAANAANNTERA